MTYEEAKEQLDMAIEVASGEMAVVLLKAFEAVKKQIPKKPKIILRGTTDWNTEIACPICGTILSESYKYCKECGQRIEGE